jgi:hypothetical protein
VTNLLKFWEADLADVTNFAKFNDNFKYLLTVIDVFSKFLHTVPLQNKSEKTVTFAFKQILTDPRYNKPIKHRPIVLKSDKGNEFENKAFQDMLRVEGIEFRVCPDPDVKCAVVEKTVRTIRGRIYKYHNLKIRFGLSTFAKICKSV